MKNRAKCKLCGSMIESFHRNDYVSCSCGEIAVDGGLDCFKVIARDYSNFLRVDDEGNEIILKVKEKQEIQDPTEINQKPTKEDLLRILDDMYKKIDELPTHAKICPISHYDFGSLLSLLSLILRCDISK